MKLLVNGNLATTLSATTFRRVLNIYPEERLEERGEVEAALQGQKIEFSVLKSECDKINIPWQIFLLDEGNLERELAHIEANRHQAAPALAAKRAGVGKITSKRILDRLMRSLTYTSENGSFSKNTFCGSLRGLRLSEAAEEIARHFKINRAHLQTLNKPNALAYLIEKVEGGQVNVAQGVLTNKLLPHLAHSRSVYKNTSGFVIKHECLPYVFLPSEVNPDERDGRQIFTLLFLLSLIGLDAYNFQIERDFKTKMLAAKGREKSAYMIASEFLLPFKDTEILRGTLITAGVRNRLASRHKITPSAVVTILLKRTIITPAEFKELQPPIPPSRAAKGGRTPPIEQSIKKFNGLHVYDLINQNLKTGKIKPIQAQHLLLGGPYKKGFRQYRKNLGI